MDPHASGNSGQLSSKGSIALNNLPSEIRRLIVSNLTPSPEHLHPGSKNDLKNANLAHSCLREWVTEYMFHDMALIHVLPGMSSHLELFALTPENAKLLKFVKHIVVQTLLTNPLVPTAIRWEVGVENPFALHLEELTRQRLCEKFGVKHPRRMTDEQQAYSSEYHNALVKPFTNSRRWHQLLRTASSRWGKVFGHFPDLEEISVGCCERVDQPRPTSTYAFFLQYGKDVVKDVHPEFVEDSTTNLAWASSIVSKSAPPNVRSLRLSMSNMDNFNSVSTVNQLLSLAHRQFNPAKASIHITKLDLSLCGIAGTHGDRDYHGDTGSAGSVRFWRSVLTGLRSLQYLTLRNNLATDEPIRFSRMEKSDPYASVLGWLLPELALDQLQTLRICDFILDQAEVRTIFRAQWPRLERIVLDEVNLMRHWSGDIIDLDAQLKHIEGNSWLEFCRSLREDHSNIRLELNRPVSCLRRYGLHPTYINLIHSIPNLSLNASCPNSPPVDSNASNVTE